MHPTTSRRLAIALPLLSPLAVATASADTAMPESVIAHYADIALAKYSDSLTTAKTLDEAIDALLDAPDATTLEAAQSAWIAARVPYQQTEVYRFGNAIVDDWEGRVNAWPLDEGLIDYVDASYGTDSDENALYTANVIANSTITIDGEDVDLSSITPALIADTLQEAGGIEANVASGYHAIEFLLWGQDLNGNDAGAGNRPASDFSETDCTNGNCDRRRAYLKAASTLLIADLEEMVGNWEADGAARTALTDQAPGEGIATILTGMGSLSYGELAGERMKLGLLLGDPEEEHDCFSDNTHASHLNDVVGINNVYAGRYQRVDGSVVDGPSLESLVRDADAAIADELRADLDATLAAMHTMANRAEKVEAYDQMIATGNDVGNDTVQDVIDALVKQTRSIERAMLALNIQGVELEGSDSLDDPNAVFK